MPNSQEVAQVPPGTYFVKMERAGQEIEVDASLVQSYKADGWTMPALATPDGRLTREGMLVLARLAVTITLPPKSQWP
jgi:hypothetical protein